MNDIFKMLALTGTSMELAGTEDNKKFRLTVDGFGGSYVMHLKHKSKTITKEIFGKRSDDELVRHFIRPAIRELKGLPPKFDTQGLRI